MDEVIIGIGINDNKKTWFPMDKRLEMIRGLFADEPRIRVEAYAFVPCMILSTRKPLPISIGSWRE